MRWYRSNRFIIMQKHKLTRERSTLNTTEKFIGESLEEKMRRVTQTNAPIEAISPMIYTERKEGVRKDTNIRTDKWEVAQEAMESIAKGARIKRAERLAQNTENPGANDVPTENSK